MAAVQGMCARIGIVTQKGLTGTLREHYPRPFLYFMMLVSFPAITLNIGADIESMGSVANLLIPAIPVYAFSIVITVLLLLAIILFPYQRIASILKWLCIFLLLYLVVPFLVHVDWLDIGRHTVIPQIKYDKEFFSILVAILGTTISPYLFFWQATMEAEDMSRRTRSVIVDKRLLSDMSVDVNSGMFFSNLVMFFIIVTTGAVLYRAGIHKIDTVEQAAKALEPLAGKFAYLIFALGVIGTGFLAIPVLAGSISYMLAETFDWQQGLDKKFNEAPAFYITIIVSLLVGLSMELLGVSPINALLYTAIVYGLTAPLMILVILHISNNKEIMGEHTNGVLSNVLGVLALLLMTAAAIALVYFMVAT